MGRRSGHLKVSSDANSAMFTLISGTFVHSEMNGEEGLVLDVLRDVLRWRSGTFYFSPREVTQKASPRVSIGEMLLTAMQPEDEQRKGAGGAALIQPSRRPPAMPLVHQAVHYVLDPRVITLT